MLNDITNQLKILPRGVSRILPGIILFGLTLIFLHKLVSLQFITIGHVEDHLRLFYPYRAYDAEMLRSLTIPLWNPYTFGGFPYLASLRSHIFYPLNLIYLILPTHLGMNLNYIVHIFLSGLFMYLLAKGLRLNTFCSLASAICFMYSGFLIDKVSWGHLPMLGSACWLPLIFLVFLKAVEHCRLKYAALAGVIFAVQFFSGHPQLPYYGLLTLSLFAIFTLIKSLYLRATFKKAVMPLTYLVIVVLVGLSLAAVQLIPASEIATYSLRSSIGERYAFFTHWSMQLSYLPTFILPRLASVIGSDSFPFPVSLGYIGVLPLLLAIFTLARLNKNGFVLFLWVNTLLSLILAAGSNTAVYGILYNYLPGFSSFRNPVLFLYLYVFSMALLAGFGMSYFLTILESHYNQSQRKKIPSFSLIAVFFGICSSLVYLTLILPIHRQTDMTLQSSLMLGKNSPLFSSVLSFLQRRGTLLTVDLVILAIILAMTSLLILYCNKLKNNYYLSCVFLLSLIFFDLFIYGKNHIRVYSLAPFVNKTTWVDYVKQDTTPYRILPILPYPEQDAVLKINKIQSINGYGSLEITQNYVDFITAFQDENVVQDAVIVRVKNYRSQAVNLLNAKYILTNQVISDERFPLILTDHIPAATTWSPTDTETLEVYLYRNKNVLPRAFFVNSATVVHGKDAALRLLKNPSFDPREKIILEKDPGVAIEPQKVHQVSDDIKYINYKENEFSLRANSKTNCFLFLSEVWYPGWKAFVDNKPTEIFRANYLFRAIHLPKGKHTVKFIFDPFSYKLGKSLTAVTGFFLIIFLRPLHTRKNKDIL